MQLDTTESFHCLRRWQALFFKNVNQVTWRIFATGWTRARLACEHQSFPTLRPTTSLFCCLQTLPSPAWTGPGCRRRPLRADRVVKRSGPRRPTRVRSGRVSTGRIPGASRFSCPRSTRMCTQVGVNPFGTDISTTRLCVPRCSADGVLAGSEIDDGTAARKMHSCAAPS